MKKIILLLGLVCLFSCEKPERCAICTSTVYVNGNTTGGVLSQQMACGKELEILDGRVDRMTEEDCGENILVIITRCE